MTIHNDGTMNAICVCECGNPEKIKHFEKCKKCSSESYHVPLKDDNTELNKKISKFYEK